LSARRLPDRLDSMFKVALANCDNPNIWWLYFVHATSLERKREILVSCIAKHGNGNSGVLLCCIVQLVILADSVEDGISKLYSFVVEEGPIDAAAAAIMFSNLDPQCQAVLALNFCHLAEFKRLPSSHFHDYPHYTLVKRSFFAINWIHQTKDQRIDTVLRKVLQKMQKHNYKLGEAALAYNLASFLQFSPKYKDEATLLNESSFILSLAFSNSLSNDTALDLFNFKALKSALRRTGAKTELWHLYIKCATERNILHLKLFNEYMNGSTRKQETMVDISKLIIIV
jgi:hypothetical protein